jgi:alpha-L-arabinofuranosidase
MQRSRLYATLAALFLFQIGLFTPSARADSPTLTVDASHPGPALSPLQHGVFFEEINHAGDGGLYAEKIQNRAFTNGTLAWAPWTENGAVVHLNLLPTSNPQSAAHYLEVRVERGTSDGNAWGGVANDGYWGIGLHKGETFRCQIVVKLSSRLAGPLLVALHASDGTVLAEHRFTNLTTRDNDQTLECLFRSPKEEAHAFLTITAQAPATFALRFVSLFPTDTFDHQTNGLRADLAQMVADLKPSFVRFPGGCFVEGDILAHRFRWRGSIGPLMDRTPTDDLWGYQCDNGLGYLEYLEWCEEMHAEPLFVVNCGMSHKQNVPLDQLQPYIQSALDAIEYANGPVTSKWGAQRAKDGHPAPFHLQYIEIGNEDGFDDYDARFAMFYDAIKARYPYMKLIADTRVKSRPPDLVDDHYYASTLFFVRQAAALDNYPRNATPIYIGEFAVTHGAGHGNLNAALGEAYFMTAMERNADVVKMASYAPLFANVNNMVWNPDAILFDSLHAYGIPSYWAQWMFSRNRGDVVLPTTVEEPPSSNEVLNRGGIGVATWATSAEFTDLKVTQGDKVLWTLNSPGAFPLTPQTGQWTIADGTARQTDLGTNLRAVGGDPNWTDYTFSLRARKLSGKEGFLIMFHVRDQDNWYWWNVGGWGNTHDNIEEIVGGASTELAYNVPNHIETGRWYDLRVQVQGNRVRCYLDNKLEYDIRLPNLPTLGVVTTRENKTGDVIIKMVNLKGEPRDVHIRLNGVGPVVTGGSAWVMTASSPSAENSFANPRAVVPVEHSVPNISDRFTYTCPPWSIVILRIHTHLPATAEQR